VNGATKDTTQLLRQPKRKEVEPRMMRMNADNSFDLVRIDPRVSASSADKLFDVGR
jgi:hypothetical protein